MNALKLFLLSFFLIQAFTSFGQDDVMRKAAYDQAQKIGTATAEGNYAQLAEHTPQKLIDFFGTKDDYISTVTMMMNNLADTGVKILSVEVIDSVQVSKFEDNYQCLVPKITIMQVEDSKMKSKSYLFGFSEKGLHWKFVEAEQLNTPMVKTVFPGFKTDIIIPEDTPPEIID